ncbi:MAG: HAMP domain-containing histidine kinase [Bacteroidetes bacterium]|nr:HAMP domain-containing histidine kinase [Bacteroidota bacterium]
MKLLYKNIFLNAGISLVIILMTGMLTYKFIVAKIEDESKEHLQSEKIAVEGKLKNGVPSAIIENNIGDKIKIEKIPALSGTVPYFATGYLEKEKVGDEDDAFISIVFECQTQTDFYKVTITKITDNDEELGENIFYAVAISAAFMMLAILFANIYIHRKLWAPFYQTLKNLQRFNISKHDTIELVATKTEEFKKLNTSIDLMAKKISEDYFSLKEFTENASHEIQTPLAVIQSKIEMCLQDERLSPQQAEWLIEAGQAVHNLVNLNKGLITLAKLDNNQVDEPSYINVYETLMERLNAYEDFIESQDISVELKMDKNVFIYINPLFASVLFDNLIKNAIKHNLPTGGIIKIEVSGQFIKISNTGLTPTVDTNKFFERFYKGSQSNSLGLGLAIVQKICNIYSLKIEYTFKAPLHVITLRLNA